MTASSRKRTRLGAPSGLSAMTFCVGGAELAVLAFPLAPVTLPSSLTPAEREVARAILDGLTNAEIAAGRRTTLRTVANQVSSILLKAGVGSRSELVAAVGRPPHTAAG